MAIFETGKLTVIAEDNGTDLSTADINKSLSAVGFDSDDKFFYMTVDKVLFSDPVTAIKTVLEAHGYVPNLENILSCLDSFKFAAYIKSANKADTLPIKVQEYYPCIRFELPQKKKVGPILQSYYDELAKYESKLSDPNQMSWSLDPAVKNAKDLKNEIRQLKEENKELREQVSELTYQLSQEQRSLSRASKALDSQRVLPDNAKICRVEDVDLKRRKIKVKCNRKEVDIPTHMLDRVPDFQARCLITFDESGDEPLGIIFFSSEELGNLEKRTAELLYVKGDTFKARDSKRNEFQIKAVNPIEAATIKKLSRGMKVVISISDGYVVRFSVLGSTDGQTFRCQIQEEFIVYDIARNQLITITNDDE